MLKLVDNTKINQTEASIPDKEMHGLWLAASNALKALQTIQETKIPIEAVYLGSDALSQVVGLSRTPQALKPKLRRLYANINLHLFEIANLTGQRKEDIVLWIEGASNPAGKRRLILTYSLLKLGFSACGVLDKPTTGESTSEPR